MKDINPEQIIDKRIIKIETLLLPYGGKAGVITLEDDTHIIGTIGYFHEISAVEYLKLQRGEWI